MRASYLSLLVFTAVCVVEGLPARNLLADSSCLAGGVYSPGNDRPGALPSCPAPSVLCQVEAPSSCVGSSCTLQATCTGGLKVPVTYASDGSSVSVGGSGTAGTVIVKGGDGYCTYSGGPYAAPFACGPTKGVKQCGFSHADFCYKPCACAANVPASLPDAKLCPGDSLPVAPSYTDTCGKAYEVTASAVDTTSCAKTVRTYTATCPADGSSRSISQNIIVADTPVSFKGCSAASYCKPNIPVASTLAGTCPYSVTLTASNACGMPATTSGTVTFP
ncbi:hypothetical protein WJX74_009227 [Apatococcus lobatus]|uniref:Uncharacterized protein n=1 Tax=Apatococcus lobatus TaxID=904363 RepID=A0AAW1SGZ2_9CHLO